MEPPQLEIILHCDGAILYLLEWFYSVNLKGDTIYHNQRVRQTNINTCRVSFVEKTHIYRILFKASIIEMLRFLGLNNIVCKCDEKLLKYRILSKYILKYIFIYIKFHLYIYKFLDCCDKVKNKHVLNGLSWQRLNICYVINLT